MTYEEIYSQFYSKKTDPTFFEKYTKEEAYELMREWMNNIISDPYVYKCFSMIKFDDVLLELSFELANSIDEYSDYLFVKDIFAQGLKICWMEQRIDAVENLAVAVGGKEEKVLLNNLKTNTSRVEALKLQLRKTIRDRGYIKNDYIGDE